MIVIYVSTLIGIIVALLAVFILPSLSLSRRKKRLLNRPIFNFEEWYNRFYGNTETNRELVKEIFTEIAKNVRVDMTQIYPEDRFDIELKCPEWWGARNDELGGFENWLEKFVLKKAPQKLNFDMFSKVKTVGDLVREIENLHNSV